MGSKIYFHPQSISNRNIQFQNAAQDKIKFSYTGAFTQKGVDYEEISLSQLNRLATVWNMKQANTTFTSEKDKEMLCLRLKYFYVQRNIHALNAIIKVKNQPIIEANKELAITNKRLIDADKKWASESTGIKIAAFILKLLTCWQFDLLQYLHKKYEYNRVQFQPEYKELSTSQIFGNYNAGHASYFIEAMVDGDGRNACEKNKEFFANLHVKRKQAPHQMAAKAELIEQTWKTLSANPRAQLEDGFYLAKVMPGYDFSSLYQMDLPNTFHACYVNGHMIDPNYVPSAKAEKENDNLLLDFNENYQRYCDPAVHQFFPQGSRSNH